MHHRLYQVRSNSLLRVRVQGKKLSSVPVPQSALSITGHIQDDTDLNRIGITIDHASDTLQHGQCASVQAEKARSSRDVYLGCDTL
jgi:hypothetical protein